MMTDTERIAALAAAVRQLAPRCEDCTEIATWYGMDFSSLKPCYACDAHHVQAMTELGVSAMWRSLEIAMAIEAMSGGET